MEYQQGGRPAGYYSAVGYFRTCCRCTCGWSALNSVHAQGRPPGWNDSHSSWPLLAELGTWEPSGFSMPSSADTLSRARPLNQLLSLSGLLQAHPKSLQIKSCKSPLLSFHNFPELEVQGRLILILPEIAAHELGRNRSNLSAEFRLCHVSDCSLPSQCKTLFPFTSHHFLFCRTLSVQIMHTEVQCRQLSEKRNPFSSSGW